MTASLLSLAYPPPDCEQGLDGIGMLQLLLDAGDKVIPLRINGILPLFHSRDGADPHGDSPCNSRHMNML